EDRGNPRPDLIVCILVFIGKQQAGGIRQFEQLSMSIQSQERYVQKSECRREADQGEHRFSCAWSRASIAR
ncbi:MAG: hypothetical protein ACK5N1_10485, partial [Gemmatimonas sp.]